MHELTYEPPSAAAADGRRLARWLAAGTLIVFVPFGLGNTPDLIGLARETALGTALLDSPSGGLAQISAIMLIASVLLVLGALLGLAGAIRWILRRPDPVLIAAAPLGVGVGELVYLIWFFTEFGVTLSTATRPLPALGYILLGLLLLTPTARRLLSPSTLPTNQAAA